jgi:hypothetical protein
VLGFALLGTGSALLATLELLLIASAAAAGADIKAAGLGAAVSDATLRSFQLP